MKLYPVFIIDDDVFYQKMISYRLQKLGYQNIICFSSGQKAINHYYDETCIVFLDYDLGDMEGIQVLKNIKYRYPDTYVIMISSRESIKMAVSLIKEGAYDYIIKNDQSDKRIAEVLHEIQLDSQQHKVGSY